METPAVTLDIDERTVRRSRSTGDLPHTVNSLLPSALRIAAYHHRRSDSQALRGSQALSVQEPEPPTLPAPMPSPSTTAAEPAHIRASPPITGFPTRADPAPAGSRSWSDTVLIFLGYTGENAKARRELVSLVWSLAFGFMQYVVVITLLAFSAHHASPTDPGLSEWDACSRPLGVWNALWLIRTSLSSILSVWTWQRARALRHISAQTHTDGDTEAARIENSSPTASRRSGTAPTSAQTRASRASTGASAGGPHGAASSSEQTAELKHTQLYARLSIFTSFVSLAWFLTAHILEYTSVNTCRLSSPHLWWLTFGLLCILYLMVLEIFLLGLLVFFVGPLFYLFWNLVLLCLGRHPLQHPHFIKPEIGKLPKSLVDQIPLVLYIPPPPEGSPEAKAQTSTYTYPPSPTAAGSRPKRRFAFLRRRAARKSKQKQKQQDSADASSVKQGEGSLGAAADEDELQKTWEDNWVPGEYPFVRLEGNRAACAICLLDFEEPQKAKGAVLVTKPELYAAPAEAPADAAAVSGVEGAADAQRMETSAADHATETAPAEAPTEATPVSAADAAAGVQEVQVEEVTEEDRDRLRLDDAGEGAQPLRLLKCGHVFHQICVDPWLIDVSGRCPICQRPVEVGSSEKRDKRRRTS